MSPRELIDATLKLSDHGDIEGLEADIWRDLQPDFRTSHFLDGFAHADKKFHFKADWAHPPFGLMMGDFDKMPSLPDHWAVIEQADQDHPFRLATSPSRSFLNTTFNETPSSQAREGKASVMIHPMDAASLDIAEGDAVTLGNRRGETTLVATLFDGVQRGVLIAESVHPNKDHIGGRGINTLTGADTIAPIGGAPFHDNKVWLKKAAAA
jgi:anaerobic selenocysteine-containing dehydrogenase